MIDLGDGHVDHIARQLQNVGNGVAPPWSSLPEARELLAERDIGAVYRRWARGTRPFLRLLTRAPASMARMAVTVERPGRRTLGRGE